MAEHAQLLRIATAGSVDDGKSTLVGRLLYDTKSVLADQIDAVTRASVDRGLDGPDLSLLVDGLRNKLRPDLRVHVAAAEAEFWQSPDFSRTVMPASIPPVLRRTAAQFLDLYRGQLRTFEDVYEVAPGVVLRRTGGHTPGHSVVRIESGGEALTFAGDAVFLPGFDNPEWQNGFEHDPEEATRVRIALLADLAASGEQLVATHLPFPSLCHVSAYGGTFRFVPATWDY